MRAVQDEAPLSAGLKGLSISTCAYQQALEYAQARAREAAPGQNGRPGKTPIRRPEVRRALLSMKSRIDAMRALAAYVAMQKDVAHWPEVAGNARELKQSHIALLMLVLDGWLTESAQAITDDALEVCGGMGLNGDTGAAQYCHDARLAKTFEGNSTAQANDLVCHNTLGDQGATAFSLIDTILGDIRPLTPQDHAAAGAVSELLIEGIVALRNSVQWFLNCPQPKRRDLYPGAVPYLELWGLICGGWMHLLRLRAAQGNGESHERLAATALSASFFAQHVLVRAPMLATTIRLEADSVIAFPDTGWLE